MAYTPFTWVDDDGTQTKGTPFSAARMNAIEQGIAAATAATITYDWNATKTPGVYRDDPLGLTVNNPIATQSGYVGYVYAHDTNVVQVIYELYRNKAWMRRYTGAWSAWTGISQPEVVTGSSFGGITPKDGDERIFVVDATAGIYWRFRYVAADSSGFPWYFIGGPPQYAAINANEVIGSTGAWVDLATAGPSLVMALAGEYMVDVRAHLTPNATAGSYVAMSLGLTGVGTFAGQVTDQGFNYSAQVVSGGYAVSLSVASTQNKLTVSNPNAGGTLKGRYYSTATGAYAARRTLSVIPIRVAL